MEALVCRLCGQSSAHWISTGLAMRKQLLLCERCHLLSAADDDLPAESTERKRYLQHQNDPENTGYVAFLTSFLKTILPYLNKGSHGLDFGCGPNPVLAGLLEKEGFEMDVYDPFFFPNRPEITFDFITCTETVEHFHHPATSFIGMISLLKPGGVLAIMTEMWHDLHQLSHWSYLRDFTHVAFYHVDTMQYLEKHFQLKIQYTDYQRITVFIAGT